MLQKYQITAEDKYKCKYCGCIVLPTEKFIFCDVIQGQPPTFQMQYRPHVFHDDKNNYYISLIYWCNCNNPTFVKKKLNITNNTYDQIYAQIPSPIQSINVDTKKISKKISKLYDEICQTFSSNCMCAFFLLCRTLIAEIAQHLIDKKKITINEDKDIKSCTFFEINKLLEDTKYFGEMAKNKFEMIRKIGNDKCHNVKNEWEIYNDNAKEIFNYLTFLLNQLYFEVAE